MTANAADVIDRASAPSDTEKEVIVDIAVSGQGVEHDDRLQFTVCASAPLPLRRILPLLESMDLEVLDEHATSTRQSGSHLYRYEFTLQAGEFARTALRAGSIAEPVCSAFLAMWHGLVDADDFNALILAGGLSWQQVVVLRALARYLRQTLLPYGQGRVQQVLLQNPVCTRALVDYFEARFAGPDLSADDPDRIARVQAARTALDQQVQQVLSLDADRVLRAYANLIAATLRTNAFNREVLTQHQPCLSFKFRAGMLADLPEPRPTLETFVYSPTVEGVHLRFGLVARGGVRWSDRLDDYRTEVLGLVKAQSVKNAVIVPEGAKGVFIAKPAAAHSPGRRRNSTVTDPDLGADAYRQFIGGLLDLVDNREPGEQIIAAPGMVCYDLADSYLVVAADKGPARFSDLANAAAQQRHFWLGDAFASGGSRGYDHKAMGITARGAWVSATQHLREIGIDVDTDPFTVVGIGDMSGDVFGNGMLLSPNIGLIAAFDHRHIFVDPEPNRAAALDERRRLFGLAASTWGDYDTAAISAGGGVWPRSAKTIRITAAMATALGIPRDINELEPAGLIQAILRAPVDLLWNGGVGTYVKAAAEHHLDIGDKFNDHLRVDADEVRARAVVEGGNLGLSPRARIEYARCGGLINSDAIDNAAGVDCSDHEVNIKILLAIGNGNGAHSGEARETLLTSMTDEVTRLVLANNRNHNDILATSRYESARMVGVHAQMVDDLVHRRGLDRGRENLPEPDEFADMCARGVGLTSPQLATLLAHVKLDLKSSLTASPVLSGGHFTSVLQQYFPVVLAARCADVVDQDPLRTEIVVTVMVNRILAVGGLTYAYRLADETAASADDILRAFCVADEVFGITTLLDAIRDADLPVERANALTVEARRLLDRASRWLIGHRPQPLQIDVEIDRFAGAVQSLQPQVGSLLRGKEAATVEAAREAYLGQGVPKEIGRRLSESLYAFSLLDIVDAAQADSSRDADTLARAYFTLSERLGIDELLLSVSALPRGDRWHALARLAIREDLYRSLREMSIDVIGTDVADWELRNVSQIQRARGRLDDVRHTSQRDVAALTVAASHIRRLVSTSV